MHKAFVIGFQRNGCRRLHPNTIAAADGIACKQAVGALVEHHDAARRMPWNLADGERSAPKLDARIRADVEGAFGMQILVGHHVAKGVRADFKFSMAHIDGFEFVHVVPVVDMRVGKDENQGFARVFADQGQNFLTGRDAGVDDGGSIFALNDVKRAVSFV